MDYSPYEGIDRIAREAVKHLRDTEGRDRLDSTWEHVEWGRTLFETLVESQPEIAREWVPQWVADPTVYRPKWCLDSTVELTAPQEFHMSLMRLHIEEARLVHRFVNQGLEEEFLHDPYEFFARVMRTLEIGFPAWYKNWVDDYLAMHCPPDRANSPLP